MNFLKIFLPVVIAIPLGSVWAGNGGVHGGKAWVCRDANQGIISVELLDLFEAREKLGLQIPSNLNVQQLLDQTFSRVKNQDVLDDLKLEVESAQKNTITLGNGVHPPVTDDATIDLTQDGCAPEQLAVYTDDGKILLDSVLSRYIHDTDRAALVLHEAVYIMDREIRNSTTSDLARKITAQFLATHPDQIRLDELLDQLQEKSDNDGYIIYSLPRDSKEPVRIVVEANRNGGYSVYRTIEGYFPGQPEPAAFSMEVRGKYVMQKGHWYTGYKDVIAYELPPIEQLRKKAVIVSFSSPGSFVTRGKGGEHYHYCISLTIHVYQGDKELTNKDGIDGWIRGSYIFKFK